MGSKTIVLMILCVIALQYIECRPAGGKYEAPIGVSQDEEFETYKKFFDKKYNDPQENAKRKALYFQNKAKIQDHNKQFEAGLTSFKMGLNHFADLTEEEFRQGYLGGIRVPEVTRTKRAAFTVPAGTSIDDEWKLFKETFKKSYADDTEDQKRKAIYIENKKQIEEHNKLYDAGQVTYSKGINHFADLTDQEFKDKHTGGFLPLPSTRR